MSKRQRSR